MDKEFLILMLAEQGLETAATFLFAQAGQLSHQATTETNAAKKAALVKSAQDKQRLAATLQAADSGIKAYQAAKMAA